MRLPEPIVYQPTATRSTPHNLEPALRSAATLPLAQGIGPQACSCGQPALVSGMVYIFGSIQPKFPSQSIEQEFYQLAVTDPMDKLQPLSAQLAYKYLRKTENFYLARNLLWVFQLNNNQDLYAIQPDTNRNLAELLAAINPGPSTQTLYHVLVGKLTGQLQRDTTMVSLGSQPEDNSAITSTDYLPMVTFDRIYNLADVTFIETLTQSIQPQLPEQATLDQAALGSLFTTAMQLVQNQGNTDGYRALNFLLARYLPIYLNLYLLGKGMTLGGPYVPNPDPSTVYTLSSVKPQAPEKHGRQTTVEVLFMLQSGAGGIKQFSVVVDVSTVFPFVVQDWNIYVSV